MTPATRHLIAHLDPQWREYFEERAGILEFDCKLTRYDAEQAAWMETSAALLKSRVRKLAEHQEQQPQRIRIFKKVDTAILATGEE